MTGMYPDDQKIEMFGEVLQWPGLDPDTGKFTNGSFTDPLIKPSFIPAESINLILDNLSHLITTLGGSPNSVDENQLSRHFGVGPTYRAVIRDKNGRAKVNAPADDDDIVNKEYLDESRVGNIVSTMINDFELAKRRYLPLEGQMIEVSLYRKLVDAIWPGSSANAETQTFYRCDAGGARNTEGNFFKLPDVRGRVLRAAGTGDFILDKDGVATSNKYDGGNAGDKIGDAIRNLKGWFYALDQITSYSGTFFSNNYIYNYSYGGMGEYPYRQIIFDTSRVVPTAPWNRDASLSARVCIIY